MPVPFKLFGLQRSGTNLARLLMLQNFEATSLEIGHEWKHGRISDAHRDWIHEGQPVRLIICVKNPYAWLVSCYNYFVTNLHADPTIDRSFQKTWDFSQFVQNPSYNFKNPIDRWNSMIRHWLEFPTNKQFSEIILHESMLDAQGQRGVLERIEKNQKLFRKCNEINSASQRVGIGMRLQGNFNFEYYEQKHYLVHYSEYLLDFVNQFVDLNTLAFLGYKKQFCKNNRVTKSSRSLIHIILILLHVCTIPACGIQF